MRRSASLPLLLVLLLPAAAAAATVTGPSKARVGSSVAVTATGLKPGRYTLTLATDNPPSRRAACVARLAGPRAAAGGQVELRGTIPAKLTCWENNKVRLGKVKVSPGAYHLVVGVPDGPAGFSAKHSFARRALKIRR